MNKGIMITAGILGFLFLATRNSRAVSSRVFNWADEAQSAGAEVNLPPSLLLAVIAQESQGDKNAVGDSGTSYGLMQIKLATAEDWGYSYVPMNPEENILLGAKALSNRIDIMGSLFDGLRAYNQGVKGASENPLKGASYANSVLQFETKIKNEFR